MESKEIDYLKKYMSLLAHLEKRSISAITFTNEFLKLRRNDKFYFSGQYGKNILKILDTMMLDVDEYTPAELFDSENDFNIDEKEFIKRLSDYHEKLKIEIGKY